MRHPLPLLLLTLTFACPLGRADVVPGDPPESDLNRFPSREEAKRLLPESHRYRLHLKKLLGQPLRAKEKKKILKALREVDHFREAWKSLADAHAQKSLRRLHLRRLRNTIGHENYQKGKMPALPAKRIRGGE